MQRRFFSNLSLLFLLNGIIKPIWIFGIDRKVQVVLGSEQYGGYYALLNLAMILNIFLDIGITNFANREIARRPEIVSAYLGSFLLIKSILLILYVFLVFIIALIIHIPIGSFRLLLGVILLQFLLSLLQFIRAHITGLHLFVKDSFLSVFDKSLVILVCGSLLYSGIAFGTFNIYLFIVIQLLALSFSCILGYYFIIRNVKHIIFKIDMNLTRAIITESKPYAIMVLLMAAYNRIDGVMLERLAGANAAGQYAKDYRLLDACGQFGVLFAGLLLPMFVKMIREKKDVNLLAGSAFSLLFSMAIFIAALASFYTLPIHQILYHDNSNSVLNIIIWAFIGNAAMYVFSTLLTANGNIDKMILLAIIGLLINAGINAFITSQNGLFQAAFACTVTQSVVASLAVYFCYKKGIINLNLLYWVRLLTFTIFLMVMSYIIARATPVLLQGIVFIGISAIAGMLLFRILTLKQVRELIRKPIF